MQGTVSRSSRNEATGMTHYDVIIIGTGAGGGTLAYHLAPSGKRILLLERGDYVPREKDNWSSRAVNVEAKYHIKEVWHEAEYLYQVHGERGVDPTDPWASAPYRFPAVQHEPRIQQLHDDLSANGLHPFHVPLGIMLDESDPQKSRCIRCETCDGFPCLIHAKSDAQVICVDPALAHPNVTLVTNARVTRLLTSPSGREITGVAVQRNGTEEIFSGDIVVSSCGAINSAALLLRSANDRHPQGLANASGVVGRHYMGHVNSVLLAISKSLNATVFQKTLGVNDFYFGDDEFTYPMGHISFVGKLDAVALAAGAPAIVPGMTLDIMAKHSLDFWLTSEDLPDPDNRVTLDRDGTIILAYKPNNDEGHRRLIAKCPANRPQANIAGKDPQRARHNRGRGLNLTALDQEASRDAGQIFGDQRPEHE
jgi:choline dehydrogenase-like flavoprotein